MRIESIDLRRYGHFEGQSFELGSHCGKLIIILGPNEAGKSTALNGIRHWLYGFPVQMGGECHRHGNEVLVGGRLAAKSTIDCLRTRKKKSPLVSFDGKSTIPSNALDAFLGDITEERFVELFGLSHSALRDGGREIADGEGHLGEALFAAASGLTGLRKLRKSIVETREALYLPRAQKPSLNVAKKEYEEAKDRLKKELVSAPEVEKWTKQAEEARVSIEKWKKVRDDTQAELRNLQRVSSARPLLQRRTELLIALRPMAGIPRLRPDFVTEWKPLPEALAGHRKLIETYNSEILRLDEVLLRMPAADTILSQADAIDKLHASSDLRTQAYSDKTRAEQLVRDTGGEAKQALREIGLDPADFEIHTETLRVDPPTAKRLRKLNSSSRG